MVLEFTLASGNVIALLINANIPVAVVGGKDMAPLKLLHPTHNNSGWPLCERTHTYDDVCERIRKAVL